MKLRILNLCSPWHIATVFRPEVWADISESCIVISAEDDTEAEDLLPTCDVVLTGWNSSFVFTAARMASARCLRLVLHTAGSVKHLFPDADARAAMARRDVSVFSGNAGIALNVAEATIGSLILGMRRWPQLERSYKGERHPGIAMPNDTIPRNGQFLTGGTIGLIALSTVARLTLPLLHPFGCTILAYDPYVTVAEAEGLGVELTGLDDLCARSDAVSIHAPSLVETNGLIGARQLGLMRDGALLVNTARGSVLDHDALAAECRDGRISVVLDVTEPEPLPVDSPLWSLPNVYIMPHVAGLGYAGLFQIGDRACAALRDLENGRPPTLGAVDLKHWSRIA